MPIYKWSDFWHGWTGGSGVVHEVLADRKIWEQIKSCCHVYLLLPSADSFYLIANTCAAFYCLQPPLPSGGNIFRRQEIAAARNDSRRRARTFKFSPFAATFYGKKSLPYPLLWPARQKVCNYFLLPARNCCNVGTCPGGQKLATQLYSLPKAFCNLVFSIFLASNPAACARKRCRCIPKLARQELVTRQVSAAENLPALFLQCVHFFDGGPYF